MKQVPIACVSRFLLLFSPSFTLCVLSTWGITGKVHSKVSRAALKKAHTTALLLSWCKILSFLFVHNCANSTWSRGFSKSIAAIDEQIRYLRRETSEEGGKGRIYQSIVCQPGWGFCSISDLWDPFSAALAAVCLTLLCLRIINHIFRQVGLCFRQKEVDSTQDHI